MPEFVEHDFPLAAGSRKQGMSRLTRLHSDAGWFYVPAKDQPRFLCGVNWSA
jgi:hypothetical protein